MFSFNNLTTNNEQHCRTRKEDNLKSKMCTVASDNKKYDVSLLIFACVFRNNIDSLTTHEVKFYTIVLSIKSLHFSSHLYIERTNIHFTYNISSIISQRRNYISKCASPHWSKCQKIIIMLHCPQRNDEAGRQAGEYVRFV